MKYCPRCKKKKKEDLFNKSKNRYDGLQVYCRGCQQLNDREYYKTHKRNIIRRNHKYNDKIKQLFLAYLTTCSCIDCGETNIMVLDFDHVRGIKKSCVSVLTRGYSWDSMWKEIQKCDVRCSNCHRIKTSKETNNCRWQYYKQQLEEKEKHGSVV